MFSHLIVQLNYIKYFHIHSSFYLSAPVLGKRVDNLKEIINLPGLFVLSVGYVDIKTNKVLLKEHILKSDSHLPKKSFVCVIESPLRRMKNAFCFILIALFVLKIFKFLS